MKGYLALQRLKLNPYLRARYGGLVLRVERGRLLELVRPDPPLWSLSDVYAMDVLEDGWELE